MPAEKPPRRSDCCPLGEPSGIRPPYKVGTKSVPRHEPDAKTSYSGTKLGFAGSFQEVI
jgi:hypothetical protein